MNSIHEEGITLFLKVRTIISYRCIVHTNYIRLHSRSNYVIIISINYILAGGDREIKLE